MKKTAYILGIVFVNLFLAGTLFKINHFPGAGIILMLSIFGFCFIFMPLILSLKYKIEKKHKILFVATFVTFAVMFTGAVFKMMHWPGAGIFIIIGLLLPFVFFLPVFIHYSVKVKSLAQNFPAIILGLIFLASYSALLSLNVSKNFLDNSALSVTENSMTSNTLKKMLRETANKKAISNHYINKVSIKSGEICQLIDGLTNDLLKYSANSAKAHNLQKDAFKLKNIDKDYPVNQLIESNEKELTTLKNKIEAYNDLVKSISELESKELQALVGSLFKPYLADTDEPSKVLAHALFDETLMITAIQMLSNLKRNVRIVEYEAINLINESKKLHAS